MDPISALLTGGLSMAGGLMTNAAAVQRQGEAENFNANQQLQMEQYQTQMSNTAYQRASADMKAAGLNPILAYAKGGASSPSGGAASIGSAPVMDVINPALSSAMQRQRVENETEMNDYMVQKVNQEVNNLASSDKVLRSQALNISADTMLKTEALKRVAMEGSKATADKAFYDSDVGKFVRQLGTTASEFGRFFGGASSAGDILRGR